MEHYEAQDKPLFELIEGDDERAHPLFSLSDILSTVIEIGRRGLQIKRFKGLGEMNPEELWSTTLDPESRNLLQVQYSKDLKKDQSLIHTLMGNDVALRKDFIISNAINVQNLDI